MLNRHAPIKRIKIKSRPNPYVTPEIKQLMKTRDFWHKKAINTNDRLCWNGYRFFRQEVKRELRLAEKIHVRNEIANCRGNTNATWKILNRCMSRHKNKACNGTMEDHQTLANKFNKYFTSVGELTAIKANLIAKEQSLNIERSSNEEEISSILPEEKERFRFQSVKEKDVESVIKSLSDNKASGFDKISTRVLKDSCPITVPVITRLVNNSFKLNTFPKAWKIAEVVPIPKEGDTEQPANNRPISLLPILSKVNERLAHKQLMEFLTMENKLSIHQSGNRKGHSTETALVYVTDELLKAIDEKKVSLLLLLDMSKAFDSLNHGLLLDNLRNLGLEPTAILWFSSYLSERYQRVRYEDSISEMLPLKHGVPQGSILGPVLFTIYINDVISTISHSQVTAYVDDCQLYFKFSIADSASAVTAVNNDLKSISNWCAQSSLLINPDKTKLVVVGLKQLTKKLPPISLTLLGKTITPVPVAKDLGVFIDQCLTYNVHVTKTASGCMNQLVAINRIKHLLDKRTLSLLINSFVFTKLFYCSTVWGNTTKANIHKLQLVQNFAARIILGLRKYDHISDGRRTLKWLTVSEKILFNDLLLSFKCINGMAPEYLCRYFKKRSTVHGRITRGSSSMDIPGCRLSTGQRSFYYRGSAHGMRLPLI